MAVLTDLVQCAKASKPMAFGKFWKIIFQVDGWLAATATATGARTFVCVLFSLVWPQTDT